MIENFKLSEMLDRAALSEKPELGSALRFDGRCCAIGYLMIRAGVHISPSPVEGEMNRWADWTEANGYLPWAQHEALAAFSEATGINLNQSVYDRVDRRNRYLYEFIFGIFDDAAGRQIRHPNSPSPFAVVAKRLAEIGL